MWNLPQAILRAGVTLEQGQGDQLLPIPRVTLVSQEPKCKGIQNNAHSHFVPRDLETFPAGWVGSFTYGLPALENPLPLTTLLAPWMCFFS